MQRAIRIMSFIITIVILTTCTVSSYAATYNAMGIDVSYWNSVNKEVDFNKVKAAGIDFVILRIGYTGGENGSKKDETFDKNYENAKKAGLNVGCYFYTYAKTVKDTIKDAQNVISWLGTRKLEYPVFFDLEDVSLETLTKTEKMDIVDTFIGLIKEAGFMSGIYTNYNWLKYHLDGDTIKQKYDIWLANWTVSGTPGVDKSSECKMWQYSAVGKVDGITGDVDMDISYFDYPTYVKQNGYNNYPKPTTEPVTNLLNTPMKVLKSIFSRLMKVVKIIAGLVGTS